MMRCDICCMKKFFVNIVIVMSLFLLYDEIITEEL